MAMIGVALGDRDLAGDASFGGQEIVMRPIESPVFEIEADGEQSALRVVEERKIHLHGDAFVGSAEIAAAANVFIGPPCSQFDRVD